LAEFEFDRVGFARVFVECPDFDFLRPLIRDYEFDAIIVLVVEQPDIDDV
jgi:hypothetical protein